MGKAVRERFLRHNANELRTFLDGQQHPFVARTSRQQQVCKMHS